MTSNMALNCQSHWKLSVLLAVCALCACTVDGAEETAPPEKRADEPAAFERTYVRTVGHQSNTSIKLIGFKKMTVPEEEVEEFDAAFTTDFRNTHKNYLWDKSTGILTIYFPVESALVEVEGKVMEASERGELDVDPTKFNPSSLSVIGRPQTASITGVEANVIKDGIIYLSEKNASIRHFDDVFVFDFGIKVPMSHEHPVNALMASVSKVSCMSNHGGLNCSDAFGIYQGRCTFNSRVCMDYNGWFTDCVNGKLLNFPGSDCDYSLGAGHCWNEVM